MYKRDDQARHYSFYFEKMAGKDPRIPEDPKICDEEGSPAALGTKKKPRHLLISNLVPQEAGTPSTPCASKHNVKFFGVPGVEAVGLPGETAQEPIEEPAKGEEEPAKGEEDPKEKPGEEEPAKGEKGEEEEPAKGEEPKGRIKEGPAKGVK